MRKRKVIVWGSALEYDYFRKCLEVELYKGSMQIEAIILNEGQIYTRIDGIEVLQIEALLQAEFDYLINLNQSEEKKVFRILELLRIPCEKVLPIQVLCQPYFDFDRWELVKNSKISIVTNHCWGGLAYNALGLQFCSPFINLFIQNADFFRLLGNLQHYIEQSLCFQREEYELNLNRNYPIASLEDVAMHFNHYESFESAVEYWNRRKARINYDNLLIEMTANSKDDLEKFLQLPYEHKICFTTIQCKEKDVVSIQGDYLLNMYDNKAWDFANKTAAREFVEFKQIDLLRLLNHESGYLRTE